MFSGGGTQRTACSSASRLTLGLASVMQAISGYAELAADAAGPTAPASPASSSALSDCHVAGIRNGVLCGTLLRPLDPARPQGASIPIRYVVVPAMARRKFADPVFLLAGGPGQSAIAVAQARATTAA